MVKVKICGITNLEDALAAQEAGADILGFIFADSPRRTETQTAREIIKRVSKDIKISALFVNEKRKAVDRVVSELGRVDFIQFHGEETPAYCKKFTTKKIIKAIRIKDERSLEKITEYKGIDFILLDTFKEAQHGGTGQTFNWEIALKAKTYHTPLFLSGGLSPENVKEAILKVKPFAVDVSSGVEKTPGKKDPELVKRFIAVAKSVF